MSRTFTHINKAKAKRIIREWRTRPFLPRSYPDVEHLWDPMSSTPSWWVHDFMTKPWRARTRQVLARIRKLRDLEDAPPLPHSKKPYIYFW